MKDRSRKLLVINTGKKGDQEGVYSASAKPSVAGGAGMALPGNLPDYLLKSIWDRVWEIKTDSQGNEYIFGKLPVVTQYGITMYADGGELNLPSIYAGIPFDNKTIWLNPDTGKVEVIGGTGGGVADSVHWNNIKGKPSFSAVATSGKYADLNGLPDLGVYATTEYLTAELKKYVTLNTEQTIGAHKDFLNGLSIGGLGITKSQDDVIYLDANLVVRGGITMFGTNSVDVPTIMDAIATDGVNLKVVDGVLTFVGSSGGGLSEVYWDDVIGRPTLLSSFINDKGFASSLGELANVGSWADSAPAEGRLLYQAAGSEKWSSISFSELPSGTSGDAKRLCSTFGSSVSGDYNDRPTSANGIYTDKSLRYYLATGNMATGKPMADGMILHGAWDNSGWNSQLFLPNNDSASMQHRSMRSGLDTTWGEWKTLLDSSNYSSYALSLNGGTLNGDIRIIGSIHYENIIHIENYHANTDTFVACSRPDTGNTIRFGVGAGGENRGIWDDRLSKWLCYADNNGFNITNNTWISHDEWNNALILYRSAYGGGSAIDVRNSSGGVGAFGVNGNKEFEFAPYVNGQIASRMTIDQNGNGLFHGGITMYSDIRKKTKLQDVELSLKQIADAPLIEHYYNSDEKRTTHVGSIAQYWAGINDWFCKLDSEGYYTMEIQNAALASAISIARELVKYESKTDRKIRLLKQRVKELEEKIEKLENN